MNSYYHHHPRGFGNECTIVRCETPLDRQSAEADGMARLTVAALRRHVAWLNEENEAWGSNRAIGAYRLGDIMHSPEYRYGAF